jgi:hypothetical protein
MNKNPGGDMKKNSVKKLIIVIAVIFVLLLSGCKKKDLEELVLEIHSSEWYTEVDASGFGFLNLIVSGYSSGTRVTVLTFGSGVPGEVELDIDTDSNFLGDVTIRFTHAPDDRPFTQSTKVRAYRGTEYVEVELESGELYWSRPTSITANSFLPRISRMDTD